MGLIHQLGYLGVFVALLAEAIGIPFPAETILVASGVEMTRGVFHFLPLWLAATAGNLVGSNFAYVIGRFLGRPVILRYGRYVRVTEARLKAVEDKFQKYQSLFLIIGKFIAFVRIAIPYIAGINQVNFWMFTALNTSAALVWSCLFLLLGKTVETVLKYFGGYLWTHLYVTIPLLVVIIVLGYLFHKWTGGHSKPREETPESH